MKGMLTHFEIGTRDAARAKRFFGKLFAWEFQPFGDGEQAVVKTPNVRGGLHDGVATTAVTVYFDVDDIEAAVATVRQLGGKAQDPTPVEPGFGRFSTCEDDQGMRFGLREPAA